MGTSCAKPAEVVSASEAGQKLMEAIVGRSVALSRRQVVVKAR